MKKGKKGDLSINIIIAASVALIVLVVLVAVFTGRFGIFSYGVKNAAKCEEACKTAGFENGGVPSAGDCLSNTQQKLSGFTSEDSKKPNCCCIK